MSAALLGFSCPACTRPLEVPSSFAGQEGRCPRCRETVRVPDSGPLMRLVPAAAPASPDDRRRPCPACGEAIVSAALKCRFCGEAFAPLVRRGPSPHRPPQPLASPGERLGAWLIDRALYAPTLILVAIARAIQDLPPRGRYELVGLVLALLGAGWALLLLVRQTRGMAREGATLGKSWLGLCVVDGRGKVPGFGAAVVRRSWLPVGIYLAATVFSIFSCLLWLLDKALVAAQDGRALHDLLAGTFVVSGAPVREGDGP